MYRQSDVQTNGRSGGRTFRQMDRQADTSRGDVYVMKLADPYTEKLHVWIYRRCKLFYNVFRGREQKMLWEVHAI